MIKLNRILAPTDFSDGSQQGLNCACELAAKFSAELQLLYVSQGWSHDLVESPNSREYLAKANDTARKQLEELPGPSWNERLPLTWFMDNGTPFLQIVKHAKSHDIDLIVMGTHGRTGWSHTLIGSVAEKVVRKAPCPVLTVRDAEDIFAPQRVLGVTDFSLHAERALSYAAAFADAFDAELHVLHVIPDAAAFAPSTKQLETSHPWSAIVANMEADAMQRMDAISLADAYPKLTVKKEIRGGLPIAQIVEYIKEQSIDLAACGTHGRGALAQALIGGVAERVVRHATCPVLTVHHPQHEFVTPFAE